MPDSDPEVNTLCDGDPLARALARLQPAPTTLGGTQLIYLAGQAARDRAVTFWRRMFLGQFVVFVAFGCTATFYLVRDAELDKQTPPVVERAIVKQGPGEPEEAPLPRAVEPESESSRDQFATIRPAANRDDLLEYLRIRREVLTAGLGLLPDSKSAPTRPVSAAELEKSLNLPPGVLTAPYRVPPPPPAPEP